MIEQELPFKEKQLKPNLKLRKFSKNTDPTELKWHWDEEDRIVRYLGETDWMFQLDNQLPVSISNKDIFVPKGVMHRLIKGSGDLTVMIQILD